MTLTEQIAAALGLALPDLLQLGEAISAEVSRRSGKGEIDAEIAAANLGADATEDERFPPTLR